MKSFQKQSQFFFHSNLKKTSRSEPMVLPKSIGSLVKLEKIHYLFSSKNPKNKNNEVYHERVVFKQKKTHFCDGSGLVAAY